MPTCPNGHDSDDEEFCEVCGLAMNAKPTPAAATKEPPPAPAPAATLCPACDTPLDGRFCEACGHDSLAPPPPRAAAPEPAAIQEPETPSNPVTPAPAPQPQAWTATVSADRDYFNTVMGIGGPDAGSITFPPFCPDRYFPLHGNQITIGRRSASRGINPGIDLTGPPEDPGVSHLHAMLIIQDDQLSIVDLNSSNGTTVNDSEDPLRPNVPRALSNGDKIHLGAWTTITVRFTA